MTAFLYTARSRLLPENVDKLFCKIPLPINYQTRVIERAIQLLLSDVLHCTNLNTAYIDISKQHI